MITQTLSDEHVDFLNEMMNVAVGSATTALSQMLEGEVEMLVPEVYLLPPGDLPGFIDDPSLAVVGAKMGMFGDITGSLFFLVPLEDVRDLVEAVENSTPGVEVTIDEDDYSTFEELVNIIVGNYMTSIHDFCGLNLEFTIPTVGMDMIQALIDSSISVDAYESGTHVIVQMGILMPNNQTRGTLLLIPNMDSENVLVSSLDKAKAGLEIG